VRCRIGLVVAVRLAENVVELGLFDVNAPYECRQEQEHACSQRHRDAIDQTRRARPSHITTSPVARRANVGDDRVNGATSAVPMATPSASATRTRVP
jgi:hypothetical protein